MENSTITMFQFENQTILDQWNSEFVHALWSDTLFLVLYIVIGVVGNSLVIIVYTLRFRNKSEERFFIPYLAVIDLVACVVCSTFGIAVNQYAVTFTNGGACKAFWLFSLFTTGCSIFTLLVIAVHRYQKICRPFQAQMSLKRKKLSLIGCIAASILLSLPALVFYGTSPVKHPEHNIMGTRCANIRGPWSKAVAVAYKGVILLVCLGVLVSLIVLYSLIGRAVFKRIKLNKKRQIQTSVPTVSSSVISSDNSTAYAESVTEDERKLTSRTIPNVTPRKKNIPGYRLSMMFMLITAVFVLCFIPKLAMMVFESKNEMFWLTLDTSGYGAYRFLYTMYIINSIINPVIYGFFDKTFRQELASLC
ncbi:gastrin/cholecystokinin type B receptor-like [Mizuhopecten yessoensis]|uniref:Cholecystokinin receptor n=1 Tax=Mizuhopecten yessoensis TaxID=6573 RepID=A0A210QP33_MIZYE|nr:gastrin/cholecystokinin type B receptor-like [Mizuhopecten yessoensis]OWF50499.1 Cholecystokinin receptor [Mizuhopecten yessoensis]